MSARTVICFVLTILSYSTCAHNLHAMAGIACSIHVNGQEVFNGLDLYSGSINRAVTHIGYVDVEPVDGSPYLKNPSSDINLSGKIEFKVPGFPTMQMQTLRLVPSASAGYIVPHWSIDPVDIAKINAYYTPIGERMESETKRHEHASIESAARNAKADLPLLNALVVGVPVLLATILLVCVAVFCRGKVGRMSKVAEK